jgi:hypothetical protein
MIPLLSALRLADVGIDHLGVREVIDGAWGGQGSSISRVQSHAPASTLEMKKPGSTV